MRKTLALVSTVLLLMAAPQTASAAVFTFLATDAGGTGSATMDFSTLAPTRNLTIKLDNTSPILLDDGSGPNTPGIVGFGFAAQDPVPILTSWSLTAYDSNRILQVIGASDSSLVTVTDMKGVWQMTDGVQGIKLDFFPTVSPGVQGAIYNPAATEGFAASPDYFSTATLTMTFASDFTLKVVPDDPQTGSPFVRMQNIGKNGSGSVKITNILDDPPPELGGDIPEPTGIVVWALLGVAGFGGAMARRRKTGQES